MPNTMRLNGDASSDLGRYAVVEQDAAAGYRHCLNLMRTPSGLLAVLVAPVAVADAVSVAAVAAADDDDAAASWGLSPGPALVPVQLGLQPVAQAAAAAAAAACSLTRLSRTRHHPASQDPKQGTDSPTELLGGSSSTQKALGRGSLHLHLHPPSAVVQSLPNPAV